MTSHTNSDDEDLARLSLLSVMDFDTQRYTSASEADLTTPLYESTGGDVERVQLLAAGLDEQAMELNQGREGHASIDATLASLMTAISPSEVRTRHDSL
jgi:hypothetical protein